MPAPRDLTGEKFGLLTVTKFAGTELYGGMSRARFWWCDCTCGRETRVFQRYLTEGRTTACEVCRRGPCVVCGGEITEDTKRNTCSIACHDEKRRRADLKCYSKRVAEDPDFNKKRGEVRAKKLRADSDKYEKWLESKRLRSREKRLNPEYRDRQNEYSAWHYEQNREQVLERRKKRLENLPASEKQQLKMRARAQNRRWRRKWRDEIANDPERYEEYLQYQREARQKHEAGKALSELINLGEKLGEKLNDDTNDDA